MSNVPFWPIFSSPPLPLAPKSGYCNREITMPVFYLLQVTQVVVQQQWDGSNPSIGTGRLFSQLEGVSTYDRLSSAKELPLDLIKVGVVKVFTQKCQKPRKFSQNEYFQYTA